MDENRLAILFQKYLSKTASEQERIDFFQMVTLPGADLVLRKYGQIYDLSEIQWKQLDKDSSEKILTAILKESVSEFDEHKDKAAQNSIFGNKEYKLCPQQNYEDKDLDKKNVAKGESSIKKDSPLPINHLANQTDQHAEVSSNSNRFSIIKSVIAVAAIMILAIGLYYLKYVRHQKANPLQTAKNQVLQDVLPGHTGAILTLGNGRSFLLDTMGNGHITSGIVKSSNSIRITNATENMALLRTPLGRQQMLILGDGTRVWLNAGSSISFPTEFLGNKRLVKITGEAYFEVVHNEKMPFEVQTNQGVIHDLGTHFNVNAYDNEAAMKVTLLEGSVRVGNGTILKPGQAFSDGKISNVNAEDAIAWVSGYFHFERADIQTVMRQLSRWYDVQVTYEGKLPTMQFGGDIQKSLKLSAVLDILSETGIHYTLNGKNLIIRL